jgi:endonuclease/exonuclease/phosphatase family metal-dependent hydrolase
MSFNIWSDAPRNARWRMRRDAIAAVLRALEPDLAGIQEATRAMIDDLHERLPLYSWIGAGRDDGRDAGEFVPIFYRAERLTIREHGHFWLAKETAQPARGSDARHPRIVTWARFVQNESGREFVHFNTHLDHLGRTARIESARLLLQKGCEIAQGEPLVMTGDFNCREASAPYRILTGGIPFAAAPHRLRDTFYDCAEREGPARTFLGMMALLGLGRIDYIFVNDGFQTLRHTVIEEEHPSSDHRPVLAALDFAPNAK